MRNRYEDNLASTRSAIAALVLASPLAAYVRPYDRDRLAVAVAGTDADRVSHWGYLSVEFVRADSNCTLHVEATATSRAYGRCETDEQGNEWSGYSLKTQLNYPSHGSADTVVVLARVEFLRQVAMLGADIDATFGQRPVYLLERTGIQAEQARLEAEAAKTAKEVREAVAFAVVENSKGMRVGDERPVAVSEKVPAGTTHEMQVAGRYYRLAVGQGMAVLARTAPPVVAADQAVAS